MFFDSCCVICAQGSGPVCASCTGLLVPAGRVEVPGIDRCRAGLVLDDTSRPIIAAMKYRRQRRLASWLGDLLVDHVPRAADAITWVPATPQRRRARGFDQGQELARVLTVRTGVPSCRLMARSRHDSRQTGLTRRQRLAGPSITTLGRVPRFVVLVDDVATTGSSLRVAARALREGGAQRVVAVVALATPSRRHQPFNSWLRSEQNTSIIPAWMSD